MSSITAATDAIDAAKGSSSSTTAVVEPDADAPPLPPAKRARTTPDDNEDEDGEGDDKGERQRVRVVNLPTFVNTSAVRGLLDKLGVPASGVRKAGSKDFALLAYDTLEQRDKALAAINGATFKKRTLRAFPWVVHRTLPPSRAARAIDTTVPVAEQLNDRVTPLWRMPYDQQLTTKHSAMRDVLREHVGKIGEAWVEYDKADWPPWLAVAEPSMPLAPVVPSPRTTGYRNKCEFSFGLGLDGKPTLGFLLSQFSDGVAVAEPSQCLNVNEPTKALVACLIDFLRTKTMLPVYNRVTNSGFWRLVQVRTTETGQLLAVVQVNAKTALDADMAAAKAALVAHLTDAKLGLHYLLWQVEGSKSLLFTDAAMERLIGDESSIVEDLLDLKFMISPRSFFQVNTPAAAELYTLVATMCQLTPQTTVLDVCCGTGTIGLTVARKVRHVIGIELVPEAIEDAKKNAALNGITNVAFHAAKVESVIDNIARSLQGQVVAVLDPPRAGVHTDVIRTIRNCAAVTDIVYVACDAKRVDGNFVGLCRPRSKALTGAPFEPVAAGIVDLFPHTELAELVVHFRRVKPAQSEAV